MRKMVWILCGCVLILLGAYRWSGTKWEGAKSTAMTYLYSEVTQLVTPYLHSFGKSGKELVFADVEKLFLPFAAEFRATEWETVGKEDIGQDKELPTEDGENEGKSENSMGSIVEKETENTPPADEGASQPVAGGTSTSLFGKAEKEVVINRVKLQEFDYLRQNFFQVDNTTTVGSDLLDVNQLLGKDMTLNKQAEGPQVLIYHTHSQEGYKDSVPGDASTTVVGVGDYLEQLLEQNYGINVLHHKGTYDLPKRDSAYSNALPNLEQVLQENPSIEVVIDLHRDGVAEDRHLVTEVNGKPTAKLMFFNGLSRTTSQGELAYLPNPYIADNLALSFQLHLAAEEYYPGLMRKIYLKGYRYNLHLRPKSILVEVGAQTNTVQEAKNAMEPLADILGKVLYNGIYQ